MVDPKLQLHLTAAPRQQLVPANDELRPRDVNN
jgi:hypothetical protein